MWRLLGVLYRRLCGQFMIYVDLGSSWITSPDIKSGVQCGGAIIGVQRVKTRVHCDSDIRKVHCILKHTRRNEVKRWGGSWGSKISAKRKLLIGAKKTNFGKQILDKLGRQGASSFTQQVQHQRKAVQFNGEKENTYSCKVCHVSWRLVSKLRLSLKRHRRPVVAELGSCEFWSVIELVAEAALSSDWLIQIKRLFKKMLSLRPYKHLK